MCRAPSATASGAGSSLRKRSTAVRASALAGPSAGARSNSIAGTRAFTKCAAICAPMTPAPSTATLRTMSGEAGIKQTPLARAVKRKRPAEPRPSNLRCARGLERVRCLQREDRYAGIIRALDQAVGCGAPLILVEARAVRKNINETGVEFPVRRPPVLAADRKPP